MRVIARPDPTDRSGRRSRRRLIIALALVAALAVGVLVLVLGGGQDCVTVDHPGTTYTLADGSAGGGARNSAGGFADSPAVCR
ncbi:hypothetical protein [Pseudonocardia acidicola]|uniref:Uncharacterized protein n=1 Tax=Pseudonocardia acidicola TaxID=2724939 RepID=A0ABX1SIU7_9PSEU|nr:hypothetical protein [Pseudonocardia acidicola]NMI00733.1 hypothetical protein [Pseudonocardia acidicola]